MGKTTVLRRIVDSLRLNGFSVGGMLSQEVRHEGIRVGFEIADLNTGGKGWLAQVSQKKGPRVGKYTVNLQDLENIGVSAVLNAIKGSDVVVIDEIGPMELYSEKFRQAVVTAAESSKLVLAVVHENLRVNLVADMKVREDAELYLVTLVNREKLHLLMVAEALMFLYGTDDNKALKLRG